MDYTLAQANPETGASNAQNFHPPTRNPQDDPTAIQQQQGIQGTTNTQNFLNERRESEITITRNPAPVPAVAKPTNDVTWLLILIALAVLLAVILYKLANRTAPQVSTVGTPEAPTQTAANDKPADSKLDEPKKKTKKAPTKRKTSKKAKRKRR